MSLPNLIKNTHFGTTLFTFSFYNPFLGLSHCKCIASIIFAIAVFNSAPLFAEPLLNEDLSAQRQIYGRAEHALKKNDRANFERLSQKIKSYPLYPYLIYEDLKRNIQNSKTNELVLEQIKHFERNYPDFPFTNSLRNLWLSQAAQNKNWSLLIKGYYPTEKEDLQCNYLFAQYQITKERSYLEQAKPLWLVGYSQPIACDQLFNAWYKTGSLTKKLIWERLKLAFENKNFILVKHLAKQLPSAERGFVEEWEKVVKNPSLITNESFLTGLTAPETTKLEIITQGLQLLAKREPERALKWWSLHQKDFVFSEHQVERIQLDIATYLAHQKSLLAREQLATLPDSISDLPAQEWRVRLALSAKDWQSALQWIKSLPPELKEEKEWLYWEARSLEALQQPGYKEIYSNLAKTRSYYGFLSSLRLKQPITLQHHPIKIDEEITNNVLKIPAIQRFHELRLIGKTALARVEWFRALEKMEENEIIAAAKIAQNLELDDIAILTIAKSSHKDDIYLRFPICLQEDIIKNAERHNLDPAWVFAIIRQESAFFTEAISPAGARGLMQIMPSTAKILSKKSTSQYVSEDSLHQAELNIELGTLYLKELKERMQNHCILATASYNAGPGSIARWLPTETTDADIWIENMPYRETREYVKNVLTFTSIYRYRLGYPSAFALLMKPINPKSNS